MSGHGVHVHGPHDHALEHAEHHAGDLGQKIAIFTAVLATIGAIVSFLGGHTQNEALYWKNEAVLLKTQASNQWNYFQAKSTKQALAEFAAGLSADPAKADKYRASVDRYEKEKNEIKAEAEKLESQSRAADEKSKKSLHPHEQLAISMTLLQIAIALASITVLTKKRWLLAGAGAAALGGAIFGVIAWF
jgi:hypothetical protein